MESDPFEDAPCRARSAELFYPPVFQDERTGRESEYYELGKYVCEHCPGRLHCWNMGQQSPTGEVEDHGLWGGSTPRERRNGGPLRWPRKRLPVEALDELPPRGATSFDVQEVRDRIKPYLERRT